VRPNRNAPPSHSAHQSPPKMAEVAEAAISVAEVWHAPSLHSPFQLRLRFSRSNLAMQS